MIRRAVFDENHPDIAESLFHLGIVFTDLGEYNKAEKHIRRERFDEAMDYLAESKSIMKRNFEDDHPLLSYPLLGIAHVFLDTYRPELAEPYLQEALEIQKNAVGVDHWLVGVIKSRLGRCLADQDKFTRAEPMLLNGYQTLNERLGPSHKRTQSTIQKLVAFYEKWSKPDETAKYSELLLSGISE